MSTSDPGKDADDLAKLIDLTGASAASTAGMPDPNELARLAAEMYGTLTRAGMPVEAQMPAMPAAPTMPAPPAIPVMPSASAIPAMPAAPVVPAAPAMPGAELAPGFGFLADVRSIEALSRDLSQWGATPSELQLRSLAAAAPAAPGVQAIPWMGGLASPGASGVPSGTIPPGASMPGASAVPSGFIPPAASVPGVPTVTPGTIPPGASMPGASPVLAGAIPPGVPVPRASSAPAAPAAAVTPVGADNITLPAFEFVTDLRSLEAAGRDLDAWGITPSEAQLRSIAAAAPAVAGVQAAPWPGALDTMSGLPPISAATIPSNAATIDAALPLVPGAAMPSTIPSMPTFGFFEAARPLESSVMASSGASLPDLGLADLTLSDLSGPFDVHAIRRDFPIFDESFNGKSLVWFDNAATTQKPRAVIERLKYFYEHENSNVHRAAHQLAARATDAYEAARETVRRFLNASSTQEIVFVRGTTEGINLVAQSWGRRNIGKDDEIVITWLEHHANIVPWQMLCQEKGAKLKVAPVDDSGQVLLAEYERLLGPRTKLVSFSHVSNALGTITPAQEMIAMAHRYGAKVVLDGAQSVAHTSVDVQQYDCDFFVFSGHKIFAPTGVGVVFGKAEILEHTPPWQGGGNMIKDVTFEKTIYNDPPVRFEAGTGTIADAVGLGAALDYVQRIGIPNIAAYEHDLLEYGTEVLRRIPGLRIIGTAKEKASVLSFVIDGYRTEDIGAALAKEGIAVRAGHHCAQPILRRFGLETTVRPSLAFYNTCEEIDRLGAALWNLRSGWLR